MPTNYDNLKINGVAPAQNNVSLSVWTRHVDGEQGRRQFPQRKYVQYSSFLTNDKAFYVGTFEDYTVTILMWVKGETEDLLDARVTDVFTMLATNTGFHRLEWEIDGVAVFADAVVAENVVPVFDMNQMLCRVQVVFKLTTPGWVTLPIYTPLISGANTILPGVVGAPTRLKSIIFQTITGTDGRQACPPLFELKDAATGVVLSSLAIPPAANLPELSTVSSTNRTVTVSFEHMSFKVNNYSGDLFPYMSWSKSTPDYMTFVKPVVLEFASWYSGQVATTVQKYYM